MIKQLLTAILLLFLIGIGCSKKMSEEQLFAEAQKFEAKEDMDGVLKIYEELDERFPNSPNADSVLQKLGMIYLDKKAQVYKAMATYERLLEKFPQSKYQPQSLFMIGFIYANHIKNFDKAKDYYDQFIAKYPEHELTAKVYEELIERFPNSPHADSVLQKLGMIYLNKKAQFDKAVATYERLVEKFPQSKYQPQSMFMIGYIYANHIKNFDKAKTYYDQFIAQYPEHELTASVQWELQHLGKDISEINIFDGAPNAEGKTNGATKTSAKP